MGIGRAAWRCKVGRWGVGGGGIGAGRSERGGEEDGKRRIWCGMAGRG